MKYNFLPMKARDILQWAMKHVGKANLTPPRRSRALKELSAYFENKRSRHPLALPLRGTAFERAVWRELTRVPSGSTITYGELARRIGHPRAARAVGTALKKNPFPILIPCHRVVPATGEMGEYGGGRQRKQWLLQWERHWA